MAQAQVAGPARAREYETIYVLRPDVTREAQEKVAGRIGEVVGKEGGRLTQVESWGRRALAYPVYKHKRGVYVYLKYIGGGPVVDEIERNLRMLDDVLKYQTVKLREDIDAATVEVIPENVKFEAVEPPGEDETEESLERSLGLEEISEREAMFERPDRGERPERQDRPEEGEAAPDSADVKEEEE
jgi:small subunit ribosomal protein S6